MLQSSDHLLAIEKGLIGPVKSAQCKRNPPNWALSSSFLTTSNKKNNFILQKSFGAFKYSSNFYSKTFMIVKCSFMSVYRMH